MIATDTYVRANGVVSRLVEDEVLIVPVRGKVGDLASIYSLNGVAGAIWEALAQPMSVEKLTQMIVSQYEVTADQARADLEPFLVDMTAAGLFSVVCATESEERTRVVSDSGA